ncbi:uncharacterized protein LOC122821070 isoform X2 [Gambusia affinis]|nr:uncharacterized protein LOC122821070 isoform X2 [Gambusia affinis]
MWVMIFLLFICDPCKTCVTKGLTVYRAKENQDVTIDWSIPRKTNWTLLNMICLSDLDKIVFDIVRGSQSLADEQFAERVHLDKDSPQEAKIRLRLSRVQTEDSGIYTCHLKDFDDVTEKWRLQMKERFILNVTTGGNDDPSRNTACFVTSPHAELAPSGPDPSIKLAVTLPVAAVVVALIFYIIHHVARSRR